MILGNPRVKYMYNKILSGRDLATLADHISSKDIPVLKTSYENMIQNECIEALDESEEQFLKGMQTISLPVEQDKELEECMNKLEAVSVENFNQACKKIEIQIKSPYLDKLKTSIDERKKNKRQENQNLKSEKALNEMTNSLEETRKHMAEMEEQNRLKEEELRQNAENQRRLEEEMKNVKEASAEQRAEMKRLQDLNADMQRQQEKKNEDMRIFQEKLHNQEVEYMKRHTESILKLQADAAREKQEFALML